jgi:tRNA(fMet)-specific endonuclease VapC
MAVYILDTDTFSHFRAGHPRVRAQVLSHPITELAVTAITVEESLSGWYAALRRARQPQQTAFAYGELIRTVTTLAKFPLLSFDLAAIARFETLLKLKLKAGRQDLRIAAIALEANATVVTCNVKDFSQVPGLAVADWSV